ncbi:radical SAM protein [Micromonospora sp. NPDC047753]|uniref:SPL family radical SAM protein n=1 Tax=Micromonospora sp. NPDC047753 TaxID=3154817 RepID=UPI0034116A24
MYQGCQFSCAYCLYRGPSDYGAHVRPMTAGPVSLDRAVSQLDGIVDIGATTDPYQAIEEQQERTRELLRQVLADEQPIFLLTRGTLVERDADLLVRLAERGLVEVCFSLITLDPYTTDVLEGRTPPPLERLAAARRLADRGIPVSFHVAPLIPGLDSEAGLRDLVEAMARAGAQHVFGAVLGARPGFWPTLLGLLDRVAHFHDRALFRAGYPDDLELRGQDGAVIGSAEVVTTCSKQLRAACDAAGLPFVSETVPGLTSTVLSSGIYRWKMPTVHDMADWVSNQRRGITHHAFEEGFYRAFAPDEALRALVAGLWRDGTLFANTSLAGQIIDGQMTYADTGRLHVEAMRTLTVRRNGGVA